MKIEIHNDGKNKYQSWEARAVINSDNHTGYSMLTLQAYGASEQQAKQNLYLVIDDLSLQLDGLKNKLEK